MRVGGLVSLNASALIAPLCADIEIGLVPVFTVFAKFQIAIVPSLLPLASNAPLALIAKFFTSLRLVRVLFVFVRISQSSIFPLE